MNPTLVRLNLTAEGEPCDPDPQRILAGEPRQRAFNAFTDATGGFHCGRWSSSPGSWRVRYRENELCVMLSGTVVIEGVDGQRQTFTAGDAFVVPAGFEGTWTVIEPASKIYAIFEPPTSARTSG